MKKNVISGSACLFVICGLLLFSVEPLAASPQTLHEVEGMPLAKEFVLNDIEGVEHKLSQYRGKPVIINFWATWCPPCRFEMPAMERAYKKLKQAGIEILAIDVGETEDQIFIFTADYPVSFPLLMDQDSSVIKQWPVIALPTSFIVNAEGRLVYRAIGGREWDDDALIDKLKALR